MKSELLDYMDKEIFTFISINHCLNSEKLSAPVYTCSETVFISDAIPDHDFDELKDWWFWDTGSVPS